MLNVGMLPPMRGLYRLRRCTCYPDDPPRGCPLRRGASECHGAPAPIIPVLLLAAALFLLVVAMAVWL